jgi:hypothetical protein
MCSADFCEEMPAEKDHETPVGTLLNGVVLQALCGACHREKTAAQGRHPVSVESHLSDELWTALVEGPAPLCLVFEACAPPLKSCVTSTVGARA